MLSLTLMESPTTVQSPVPTSRAPVTSTDDVNMVDRLEVDMALLSSSTIAMVLILPDPLQCVKYCLNYLIQSMYLYTHTLTHSTNTYSCTDTHAHTLTQTQTHTTHTHTITHTNTHTHSIYTCTHTHFKPPYGTIARPGMDPNDDAVS